MIEDLKFYLSLFWRRLHYFLVISIAVSAIGLTMAYTLPPTYKAEARLLVEAHQITASTVVTESNELLQIIRQNILTRNNLLDLSRRFDVHATTPDMGPDEVVADMSKRISFSLPTSQGRGRRSTGASFIIISFSAPAAAMSAAVTNDLVTQFLQENVSLRTSATAETLVFFKQEVARLDDELTQQGGKILQFKLDHKDALPDGLDYRRARQATLQERLLQTERVLAGLNDRRDRMVALFERTGNVGSLGQSLSPEEQRLRAMEAELASALVIYSEENPRIVNLKAQVGALRKSVSGQIVSDPSSEEDLSIFDMQLSDLDGQIDLLEVQKTGTTAELEVLVAAIEATPANAVRLGTLERDYDNIRVLYNNAATKLAAARTGDRVEAQSRGQRIVVVEQAVEPNEPNSPDRQKIALASVGAGLGLGIGFIVLLELLNNAIRRPAEISTRLGIKPFAVIPLIRTKRQRGRRRLIIGGALLFVAVGIPLTLYLLHLYFLPMDLLVDRALEKSGLSGFLEQLR